MNERDVAGEWDGDSNDKWTLRCCGNLFCLFRWCLETSFNRWSESLSRAFRRWKLENPKQTPMESSTKMRNYIGVLALSFPPPRVRSTAITRSVVCGRIDAEYILLNKSFVMWFNRLRSARPGRERNSTIYSLLRGFGGKSLKESRRWCRFDTRNRSGVEKF